MKKQIFSVELSINVIGFLTLNSVFAELDSMWGQHAADKFADWNNCQLPHFNSRCRNPSSEAVNASSAD